MVPVTTGEVPPTVTVTRQFRAMGTPAPTLAVVNTPAPAAMALGVLIAVTAVLVISVTYWPELGS